MKTKTLIKTTLILLLLLGCNKDDDTNEFTPSLPEATQTGKNTFGCYIDGVLLTPRDGSGTFNSPDYGMEMIAGGIPPEITYWEIRIRDFKSEKRGIMDIYISDLHENGEGEYIIEDNNCQDTFSSNRTNNIRSKIWNESTQSYNWYCSIENSGIILITRYDFDNQIASATFNCELRNIDNPEDIIEITNGRFDIKWNTLLNTTFP